MLKRNDVGLGDKNSFPNENIKLKYVPSMMVVFVFNFLILSSLKHKEKRFLASLFLFGEIANAFLFVNIYHICRFFDDLFARIGGTGSCLHKLCLLVTGFIIKGLSVYVVWQPKKRICYERIIFHWWFPYLSSMPAYAFFSGRHPLVQEQPESVYFLDKF